MLDSERIYREVDLQDDEGCIVFGFGCYFPLSDPKLLVFSFGLEPEEMSDYTLHSVISPQR